MSYPSINKPFEDLGNSFRNIPHIIIGGKGASASHTPLPQEKIPAEAPYNQPNDFDDKQKKILNWALTIAILAVLGYAAYRIIKTFISGG